MVAFGVALAAWIALTVVVSFLDRIKHAQGPALTALFKLPRGYWGMQLAHLGLAWAVAGITLVSGLESERNVKMNIGDTTHLSGYTFTFRGAELVNGPNYRAARGDLLVTHGGSSFALHPEKRIYNASGMPMTEAAIDYGFTRDVYAAMGEELGNGAWTVRVFHKPFINWLWIGGAFMMLGGALAASDRRYRIALQKQEKPATAVPEGARA
jgi:cytochrome c-type biogenesis protein CcmF